MKKSSVYENHLAQMLEIWCRGCLLKWWPQGTKRSAALGFGFELLNSGERFRAIFALFLVPSEQFSVYKTNTMNVVLSLYCTERNN